MEEKYQLKEGCLTIQMPKELDHHEAGRLKMEAVFLMGAYHVRRLVFDFRETEFMDSSGIGVIIGRCKSMGFSGGEVAATNMNERVKKIFMVSGLQKTHVIGLEMGQAGNIRQEKMKSANLREQLK